MNIAQNIYPSCSSKLYTNITRVVLCILDGVGISHNDTDSAWAVARKTTIDALISHCPHTMLSASGHTVGLPDGQMGNSEVGHMTIGAGRIVPQDLVRINSAISDGTLYDNPTIQEIIRTLNAKYDTTCHIFGLLSDGGVHAHIDHLIAIIEVMIHAGITKKIQVHIITDGRDTHPMSATTYIEKIEQLCAHHGHEKVCIATVCGRYYAMDRDNRTERTELAYDAIAYGTSKTHFNGACYGAVMEMIRQSYANHVTDEFIIPTASTAYDGIHDGDCIVCTNFRADRVRQIMHKLVHLNKFAICAGMVDYSEELSHHMQSLFSHNVLLNTLGEVISQHGKTQLRAAETEKYAHVTFFFNGGMEKPFHHEHRILIPSPHVATYDMQPEMAAHQITSAVLSEQRVRRDTFVCINYANTDMVGHTGNFHAGVRACEVVDRCIWQLLDGVMDVETIVVITADHGNIENLRNTQYSSSNTQHTNNPVPFIVVDNETFRKIQCDNFDHHDTPYNMHQPQSSLEKVKLRGTGSLADVAPTILDLLNITQPGDMSGVSLLRLLQTN